MPGSGGNWIEGGEVLWPWGGGQGWVHHWGRRRTGGREKGQGVLGEGLGQGQGQRSVSLAFRPATGKLHTD